MNLAAKGVLILMICLCMAEFSHGQDYTPKVLNAIRIEVAPDVDGDLSDAVWADAPVAKDFIAFSPVPDVPSSQKTEVKILYDDEALYIGAYMYDTATDSILKQLTARDGLDNADFFSVVISCYQDGQNGFEFGVTPSGVQRDVRIGINNEDASWNAVWQCNVQITDSGWVAEYKLPFSALRFPDNEIQEWDINFYRSIRRLRQGTLWSPRNPAIEGFINQMGVLKGVEGIKPPLRLAFFPYLTGYYDRFPTQDGGITDGFSYAGGLDIKYGISDAFTLDATLIPDFGQVVFDPQVLNLSPFEVFFDENRQFFTEGTELFQKGELFYSRRIGGSPINLSNLNNIGATDSIIEYNPTVQLLNASKVSGRTKSGLGIGVLNAVTATELAVIGEGGTDNTYEVEISPLSNYNVLVFDQNLKNNSSVTLVNTSVLRNGSTYDANVTGVELSLLNKENSAGFYGGAAVSQFYGAEIDEQPGVRYNVYYDKSGGKLNYGGGFESMDNRFDSNDLGFNANNNVSTAEGYIRWNEYEPFWKLNNARAALSVEYNRINTPSDFTELLLNFEFLGNTRGFNTFGGGTEVSPYGFKDYFEPRAEGRYFNWPRKQDATLWISSDYRKKVALDARWWSTFTNVPGFYSFNYRLAPRFRISDKLMVRYIYSRQNIYNQPGYAGGNQLEDYPEELDNEIIFGRRNRVTHTNVLFVDYILTNRMGFSANLRHYWSNVKYKEFYQLTEDGGLEPTLYDSFREDGTTLNDNSFNALTLDAIFRWVFSPGSEISAVYKIALIDSEDLVPDTFSDNLDRTLSLPQSTSFSIRVSYYLDWLDIKNKGQRIKN